MKPSLENTPPEDLIARMDELNAQEKPDYYAIYHFLEAMSGESPTKKRTRGRIRELANMGRLGDVEKLIKKLNDIPADQVKDDIDLDSFTQVINDTTESIAVIRSIMESADELPPNAISLGAVQNTLNAASDEYRRSLRKKA